LASLRKGNISSLKDQIQREDVKEFQTVRTVTTVENYKIRDNYLREETSANKTTGNTICNLYDNIKRDIQEQDA